MNALDQLQAAIDKKDGNAVEDALMLCYDKEVGTDYVGVLIDLLLADWHMRHENGLQIIYRRGRELSRVSDQDDHLTHTDAYDIPEDQDKIA